MGGRIGKIGAGFAGVLLVAVLAAWAVRSDFAHEVEEHSGLNLLFQLRGPLPSPSKIFIVDVGKSYSGKTITLPPVKACANVDANINSDILSRCELASLIQLLSQHEPAVIALDIAFEKATKADPVLAQVITDAGNVIILKRARSVLDPESGILREQLLPLEPLIQNAALGAAPFPVPKRPEQLTRYWTFHPPFGNHPTLPTLAYYAWARERAGPAALPSEISQTSLPLETELMNMCAHTPLRDIALRNLGMNENFCRVQAELVNFYGGPGTIPILGLADLSRGALPNLKGSSIFLGSVSRYTYQQQDAFRTVFSDARGFDLSGVEIAATVFANLRDGLDIRFMPGLQWLLGLAMVGLTCLGCRLASTTTYRIAFMFALWAILAAGAIAAFSWLRFWLPLFIPCTLSLAVLVLFSLYDNKKLRSRISLLRTAVNNYIFPWQENEYLKNLSPGKHHRAVYGLCIKFDFEDYSILSSRISTEELTEIMNANFEWAIGEISRSGGQIVNPGDDSFLAYWELNSQSARALTLYALSCAAKIAEGNPDFAEDDQRRLRLRAGVSLGSFALGNVGGYGRYTVNLTGQVVNQAARIEQMNRMIGTRFLCSEAVAKLIPEERCRYVGTFPLKGLPLPTPVYEIHVEDDDDLKLRVAPRHEFQAALSAYEGSALSIAKTEFARLHEIYPEDGPVIFYCQLTSPQHAPAAMRHERRSGETLS